MSVDIVLNFGVNIYKETSITSSQIGNKISDLLGFNSNLQHCKFIVLLILYPSFCIIKFDELIKYEIKKKERKKYANMHLLKFI
jgi:hypothetical protein